MSAGLQSEGPLERIVKAILRFH